MPGIGLQPRPVSSSWSSTPSSRPLPEPATGPARIGLVIVHWNQPDRCLKTVQKFRDQSVDQRIVVVDNGSTDAALDRLRAELPPEVEIAECGVNVGFGPATNRGFVRWLRESDIEYLAVAPHDALPADGSLEAMVDLLDDRPQVGLLSADVGDGETPFVDPYFGSITRPARVTEGFEASDYPHGTLMMARRACLADIGLFDERYFAYCEEADLGLRARAGGWEVGLLRGARVVNPTMRSGSAAVDYLQHRNTLLLVRDHSGRYHAFIRFCIAVIQLVRGVVQPKSRPLLFSERGRVRGLVDFLRGRYGPPPDGYFDRLDAAGDPVT